MKILVLDENQGPPTFAYIQAIYFYNHNINCSIQKPFKAASKPEPEHFSLMK